MRSDAIVWFVFAGLLAVFSALVSFFLLLLAIVCFGNFNFGKLWHILVFGGTVMTPFVIGIGYIYYLRKRTWWAFGISLLCTAFLAVTWLLWHSPQSRGLIH